MPDRLADVIRSRPGSTFGRVASRRFVPLTSFSSGSAWVKKTTGLELTLSASINHTPFDTNPAAMRYRNAVEPTKKICSETWLPHLGRL